METQELAWQTDEKGSRAGSSKEELSSLLDFSTPWPQYSLVPVLLCLNTSWFQYFLVLVFFVLVLLGPSTTP